MSKQGTNRGGESSHCSRHSDEDLAHLSDKDLFAKWQAGDSQAFETLYDRYNNKFVKFATAALWRGGDKADGRVQELWIVLIEKYDPSRGEFEPFAFTVLKNLIINRHRSNNRFFGRNPAQEPDSDNTAELKPSTEIIMNTLFAKETMEKLRKKYPEDHQLFSDLKRNDYDQKETAAMRGELPNTFCKKLERARKRVKKMFDSFNDWPQL